MKGPSRFAVLSLATAALFATASGPAVAQNYQITQPKGRWQTPGAIQQPKGPWLTPGPIQIPRGIQAISTRKTNCVQWLTVGSDALFEFNKWTLSPQAEKTLAALGPLIRKAGKHPVRIEGHTDSVGSDAYNQDLSEKRARTVRDWLVAHKFVPASTPIQGFGKTRPVAPNTNPDGSDNPKGRQKNRRVEVAINSCA